MDNLEISPISPVRGTQPVDEITPPAEVVREDDASRVNSRMPWAALLDLGTGIEPAAYAEYTGNDVINQVSIKIIDPSTGGVIREMPSSELLSLSEALSAYEDLGRRHGGSL
ncbi:MAG: flagellar protein FlaG [Chloroflexota bacterium]